MLMGNPDHTSVDMAVPHGDAFVLQRYVREEDVPMTDARQLLRDHAVMMHGRMVGAGGPDFDINIHINAFWNGFDAYLPPNGSYYLAHDASGRVVGTAALKRLSETTGEMKHLYVRPEARRKGIAQALVEARIRDAREMGLKELVADTFSPNFEQPALYDKLGFELVGPSEMGTSVTITPELASFILYFKMTL